MKLASLSRYFSHLLLFAGFAMLLLYNLKKSHSHYMTYSADLVVHPPGNRDVFSGCSRDQQMTRSSLKRTQVFPPKQLQSAFQEKGKKNKHIFVYSKLVKAIV